MGILTKDSMSLESLQVMGNTIGHQEVSSKAISKLDFEAGKESGRKVQGRAINMRENGWRIKKMAMESLPGHRVTFTKGII
jgi:hypothetical protein